MVTVDVVPVSLERLMLGAILTVGDRVVPVRRRRRGGRIVLTVIGQPSLSGSGDDDDEAMIALAERLDEAA